MGKRYFSHYTFIYPDLFLRWHVTEELTHGSPNYFPYTHEIANTEFHSGLLIYLPANIVFEDISELISRNEVFADLIERNAYLVRRFSV